MCRFIVLRTKTGVVDRMNEGDAVRQMAKFVYDIWNAGDGCPKSVNSIVKQYFEKVKPVYVKYRKNDAQRSHKKKKVGTIAPKKFIARLRKEKVDFDNYMQQDAHEFLNFLINHINEIIVCKYFFTISRIKTRLRRLSVLRCV